MVAITVGKNETIDRALRRFKNQCQRAGILKDFKKNSYYTKPSDKRKMARNKAKKRQDKLSRQ